MAPSAAASPLRSMTGCGTAMAARADSTCRAEIRSVNNRFFKLSLRAPDGFGPLEPRIESLVRGHVRRGAVQVDLELSGAAAPAARRLDHGQLQAYLDDLERFCAARDLPLPRSIDGLLGLPGILVDAPPDADAAERAWPLVSEALTAALGHLDAMRAAEAAALADELRRICRGIADVTRSIATRVPRLVEEHRERLIARVGTLLEPYGVAATAADVLREVALLADRGDVAEEMARIDSHLAQAERLLVSPAAGRPLDFLGQELAREVNTIGSKVADAEVAHAVVDLKTQVERFREQVQNLE